MEIAAYSEAFLRLFYPAHCCVCRAFLRQEEKDLCPACKQNLSAQLYQGSGMEAPRLPGIHKLLTLYSYTGTFKSILSSAKFSKKPWLLKLFRKDIESLAVSLARYDALVPVPMHSFKRIQREFDPAGLLAAMIELASGIPAEKLLSKPGSTPAQNRLSRRERKMNLYGAFLPARAEKIRGRAFLLVDDVLTTGATLTEAARVLKQNGAGRVDAFALGRVDMHASELKAAPEHKTSFLFEEILL